MIIKKQKVIFQQAVKRSFDLFVAFFALLILCPLFVIISIAIKFDSHGEVIYRQKRIGKNGREFTLFKFRTMLKNSDDRKYIGYLQELIESEKDGNTKGKPYRKMAEDSRITRIGKYLRKYYLDELPQFVNVLRGEMSIVGPRPHVQLEVANYTKQQYGRLSVKPGITGMWQARGKAECTFSELIQMDLDYIDQWNFWMDLKMVFDTIKVMFTGGEKYFAEVQHKEPDNLSAKPLAILVTGPNNDISNSTFFSTEEEKQLEL